MGQALYNASQVRELDRIAIESFAIDSYELMCRAGTALFQCVQLRWPTAYKVLILCGAGNNGGDGYVLARLLLQAGCSVSVYSLVDINCLKNDAKHACEDFLSLPKSKISSNKMPHIEGFELIVDAALGSGIDRDVDSMLAETFAHINNSRVPVLAVDMPSGLNSSTGAVMGAAIKADVTVTFIGQKRGLLTNDGPDYAGKIFLHKLGLSPQVYANVDCLVALLEYQEIRRLLPKRKRNSHKGCFGSLLFVGGNYGMGGAITLASNAALRSGAGLVKAGTRTAHDCFARLPDVIGIDILQAESLQKEWQAADVIAIGPGLGVDDWALTLFKEALRSNNPKVLDADALNLLAKHPVKLADNCVITPHPKEAARLLDVKLTEIQQDRFQAAKMLAQRYDCIVVLKGCGSLITDGKQISVCTQGNPGMAVAGMGDVLTGIIASLLGQGLTAYSAAKTGVYWHAIAGDAAYLEKGYGLVASDITSYLSELTRLND